MCDECSLTACIFDDKHTSNGKSSNQALVCEDLVFPSNRDENHPARAPDAVPLRPNLEARQSREWPRQEQGIGAVCNGSAGGTAKPEISSTLKSSKHGLPLGVREKRLRSALSSNLTHRRPEAGSATAPTAAGSTELQSVLVPGPRKTAPSPATRPARRSAYSCRAGRRRTRRGRRLRPAIVPRPAGRRHLSARCG